MPESVRMPALGESVTEGTITRWLKQEGERVEMDEPLLEVSTDKVDTEIPSPSAGVVSRILVPVDEVAEVGTELAIIDGDGAAAGADAPPAETAAPPAAEAPRAEAAAQPPATAGPAQATEAAAVPATTAAPGPAATTETAPAAGGPVETATAPPPAAAAVETAAPPPPAAAPVDTAPALAAAAPVETGVAPPAAPSQPAPAGEVGYVTPLVRKLAAEHDIDLSTLPGTGVGGRIRKQDVLAAAEAKRAAAEQPAPAATGAAPPAKPAPSPLRGRTEKLPRMRALIARRMVESLQISAQLTTMVEVDVTKVARLRELAKAGFQATHGVKLTFLPFFALATVEALRVHPSMNASIDQEAGTVTYHDAEHLAVAVDTERGLVVPVVRDAGDLSLAGLARRIADVAERTRANKVSPDELSGGTFTLTNTGSRGALFDTPIINQPQVGILGTGTVVKRAVVVDDPDLGELIVPRSMVYLALTYDHRLVDGADAMRFLGTIKERLETGSFESELGLA